MDFKKIEKKWQKKWAESKIYNFDEKNLDNKFYMLEMFSYPSGAKLHLGHWWNYGLSDSYARFKRMQGYNVFHPMGFDAFGLPAENYAIKTGIHPSDSTHNNIDVMEEQLKNIGGTFDWNYEIKTCDEDYYKWTQWIFLQLYKKGLAYQKYAPVNWCTSCNTVLANEQVVDGKCERCGHEVIKKNLTQWFFKITEYCEQLLEGLNKIDWPEHTKTLQRNWIGKSVGAEVDFSLENGDKLTVFTSRADTLFGVSFVVIAPENDLVKVLTTPENKENVEKYIFEATKKEDIERTSTVREKTGVFTGSYAINPVNNKKVPVFVADYVLNNYGTGCVMGVAAHDDRDYDFAKKYNLSVDRVIDGGKLPFCEDGILINSEQFNGLTSEKARSEIVKYLEKINMGRAKINYKLRDWSVSRQRYWGCPIPIIYCEHCGTVPVPEKDLPVKLPYNVDWTPDGKSPLAKNEEYVNCICPICGKPAKRDVDTLDTYICSSWYQLRYPNAKNDKEAFKKEFTNKILPVDKYVGGIEHATGHLLYSRFITKALNDMGYINFDEPFKSLVHQGIILGPDGNRMSKSRGNTVSADELINQYGSDALRLYLMFGFNYIDGGPWSDDGIKSISKFIERVERVVETINALNEGSETYSKAEEELNYVRNFAIKEVSKDFEVFSFNTSIARIMELVNGMYKYLTESNINVNFLKNVCLDLIKLLAPAMPHTMEELWEQCGQKYSVFNQKFPVCDETKLKKSSVEIVVQINSKIICRIEVPANATEQEACQLAKQNEKISQQLQSKNIVKTVFVKGRLLNFIIR